ncbi:circularly permuted type 2 ATP-grasp protein [Microbacterium aoyamense]|uniref:Circularly permuted type 2 ATP-grasp protein n=1 Tax=Microbacterium aoyamense TaxID=344166 RepID=A0ABP5AVE7_9MICO|nr:circularly permuted type 2 ATP-grasp protein [Microbacterium aoyamense]
MSVLHDYAAGLTQAPLLPLSDDPTGAVSRFDEVIGPEGTLRPAWKSIASATLDLTSSEIARVDAEIARALADDGVTYTHRDGARPWRLDPFPLVLEASTWNSLQTGLAQRAELLNAIMADVYGEQRLLADGVIPAAAIVAHPGFIRAVARPSVGTTHPLLMTATDLGRDADGEWRVLADRVQAPSGLGYAMTNRSVVSRLLPELYREADVHRLEPFFAAFRDALLQCAAVDDTDPRVVVLSPGTHSETAYDQAFIANSLGFPLVQGSDLVVSEGSVWIKPPRWPRSKPVDRVDVILRRVDSEWSDPLELRGDSRLGVAGLVEAVRRGRVRVVNGLGAGVLENPALLPFLPAACERLLGEQLRLPAAPAWWCGDGGLDQVLERLRRDPESILVRTLAGRAVPGDDLEAMIRAHPYRFVGIERLPLSQAPVWGPGGEARARTLVVRAFTLRHGPAYRTLAGGLATARDDAGAPLTKDVWVRKADASESDQGLPTASPRAMEPSIPAFAPRALADMYWAGRYAERAEDALRLVIAAQALVDRPGGDRSAAAGALLTVLRRLAGSRSVGAEADLRSALVDAHRSGSAAHALSGMRTALEGVRDQLSGDTWRVFSYADRAIATLRESTHPSSVADAAEQMLTGVLSLHGVTASMIRDTGWHMIEAGRYLERALQVCTLLTAVTESPRSQTADRDVLDGVLLAAESLVTHRRRYRGYGRVRSILDLLVKDAANPRSIAFSLDRVQASLAAMPDSTGSTRPERLLHEIIGSIESVPVMVLTARSDDGVRDALAAFLSDTSGAVARLSHAIEQLHFEGGPPALEMSSLSLIEEMTRS